jgi:transcriptional regulator with XRE-family HTH domain
MPRKNGPTGDLILDTLHAERVERGLSLLDVARLVGRATCNSTWQWETGYNDLRLSSLRAWAGALGFDVVLMPQHRETCPGCGR